MVSAADDSGSFADEIGVGAGEDFDAARAVLKGGAGDGVACDELSIPSCEPMKRLIALC
jgi:hypothetical protein